MTTQVDDVFDTKLSVHDALSPLMIKALSYAHMSNARKAEGDHSNYFEEKFIDTVECIAHVLTAAFGCNRSSYEVWNARRHELENYLGDQADDPEVWNKTFEILRGMVQVWRDQ